VSARKLFDFVTDSFTLIVICLATLISYAVFTHTEYQNVWLGDHEYRLEVVDTDGERASGLGSRQSMPQGQGMLFVYTQPAERCFWMKDMRFDLDMVWLNASKQVQRVERDVPPGSYPRTFCADDAQYVIELNAGQAAATGLKEGQQITF
jgi:uncharacterized membrane protein (UPF0127 family)